MSVEARVARQRPELHSTVEGAVAVQTVLHPPQWLASVWVSTQAPLQLVLLHTHDGTVPLQVPFA
jgi:hypothetical protein